MSFEDACLELVRGHELMHAPMDLEVLLFLQAFPGYTRETMLRESASFIERARLYLLTKARAEGAPDGR